MDNMNIQGNVGGHSAHVLGLRGESVSQRYCRLAPICGAGACDTIETGNGVDKPTWDMRALCLTILGSGLMSDIYGLTLAC